VGICVIAETADDFELRKLYVAVESYSGAARALDRSSTLAPQAAERNHLASDFRCVILSITSLHQNQPSIADTAQRLFVSFLRESDRQILIHYATANRQLRAVASRELFVTL